MNSVQVIEERASAGCIEQVVSINNSEVFYFDTDDYTVTMEKLNTGEKYAYYKNKSQNTLSTFCFNNDPDFKTAREIILSGNQAAINTIALNTVVTDVDGSNLKNSVSTASSDPIAQIIGTKLESMYGKVKSFLIVLIMKDTGAAYMKTWYLLCIDNIVLMYT